MPVSYKYALNCAKHNLRFLLRDFSHEFRHSTMLFTFGEGSYANFVSSNLLSENRFVTRKNAKKALPLSLFSKIISSIPSQIVRVHFFNHECIAHVGRRNFPLSLHTDTIIGAFIMNIMLADILFDKCNIPVGVPVSIDGKITNLISSMTFNLIIEDVQVVNGNLVILTILLIDTLPHLVGA